jgi:hypothetical protein
MTGGDLFGHPTLVGRIVEMPTPCPRCTGTSASIGHGRGPHAASLLCACGNHLGWLPHAAVDFILEVDRVCGVATSEPIMLRGALGHAKEAKAMGKPQYDNGGLLFRNDDKQRDGDRDYQGSITVAGVEYWVSGWIKQGKRGKFMSLAVKPKDATAPDKSRAPDTADKTF